MITTYYSNESKPCLICGELTHNVDTSHARICSIECMKKFNEMVKENER